MRTHGEPSVHSQFHELEHQIIAVDRFNGQTQWIFKIDTNTPLAWRPTVAEGVPERLRQLDNDLFEINRRIDDTLKAKGPGPETSALQKKRSEIRELQKVEAFGDNVYFISRQVLYCLDRLSGGLRWTHRLNFIPSARPFAIRNYVFVAGADLSRVWTLDVQNRGAERTFYKADITAVENHIMNRPIYSAPSLFFVCHDSKVYSYNVDTGDLNWTYRTERKLQADPVVHIYRQKSRSKAAALGAPAPAADAGNGAAPAEGEAPQDGQAKPRAVQTTRMLFVGGTDYTFYALDGDSGAIIWKYETGAQIKTPAVVKDETVYVKTHEGALYAFEMMPMHRDAKGAILGNRRNGSLRWKVPLADRFLFKGKERVYIVGPRREIWAMDEMTGKVVGRYPTVHMDHLVTNTKDEFIYVANSSGYVFCLKESKQSY